MAQLMIDGHSYGPHPFICQIRDLKTHQPLEGIGVGDIGPKMGYKYEMTFHLAPDQQSNTNSTMDNGFLLFDNVKIPHVNMLAR